jgi:hypothetical protein
MAAFRGLDLRRCCQPLALTFYVDVVSLSRGVCSNPGICTARAIVRIPESECVRVLLNNVDGRKLLQSIAQGVHEYSTQQQEMRSGKVLHSRCKATVDPCAVHTR